MKKIYTLFTGTLAIALMPAFSVAAASAPCQENCPMGMECGASRASSGACEEDCRQQVNVKDNDEAISAAQQRSIERLADRPFPRR